MLKKNCDPNFEAGEVLLRPRRRRKVNAQRCAGVASGDKLEGVAAMMEWEGGRSSDDMEMLPPLLDEIAADDQDRLCH